MRELTVRDVRLIRGAMAALAGVALLTVLYVYVPKGVRGVAQSEIFRVGAIELEGARYLTLEEAAASASVPVDASVWDDPADWEARLAAHPMVRSAHVRRRLPTTLVLVVEEREPVGLTPTPTLQPVDVEGKLLPLDPSAVALDLPLLRVDADAKDLGRARSELAAEAHHLGLVDPEFAALLSELAADVRGDLIARWSEPAVTFRFERGVSARRLREGMLVLADATSDGGTAPVSVDLRFAEQVVVRRAP